MTRALITGAAGFLARHLAVELRTHGVEVWGLDARAITTDPCCRIADVTDPTAVGQVVAAVRPDLVFHLAGGRSPDHAAMHALHVNGTTAVLSAVERFASSARVS